MGTIEKRGSSSWRIGVQVKTDTGWMWIRDTIRVPEGLTEAKARKYAEQALTQLEARINSGQIKPARHAGHTVRSFSEYWLENHVSTLAPVTRKTYRHFLDCRILPMLGDVPLKRLTPAMLTEWLTQLRGSPRISTALADDQLSRPRTPSDRAKLATQEAAARPLSPTTIRHYYDTMDAMLDKAVQWEFLTRNPMDKVDRPRVRRSRPNYLTEDQAVRLLTALEDEPNMSYRAALLLALLCGLRLGEVGALKLSDVNWEEGTIDVSRALKYTPREGSFEGDPKSSAGSRLIALPISMMALLEAERLYQQEMKEKLGDTWAGEGWIVHGWNGAQLNHDTPSKWFRRFADAHGFPGLRFHDLRHTHATILLANNIDAVAVATRLGHSDATVTLQTYAHALRRRDHDAAQAIQSIFDRATAADQQQPTPPPDPHMPL